MAQIENNDLMVVQLQDSIHPANKLDQIVSVKFKTLVDSAVGPAIAGTADNDYDDGEMGLMYPGQGFYYDESSGKLDVKIDSVNRCEPLFSSGRLTV